MKITFHSINSENNKICFTSDGYYENDVLVFEDKSISNTKIYLNISSSFIEFQRKGEIEMYLKIIKNQKTAGYYKNSIGLDFEFEVNTKEVIIKNNKILLEYSLILDNEEISTHKILILLHKNT